MYDKNIFRQYQEILEEETVIQIEEFDSNILFNCPKRLQDSVLELLEEEYFDYIETDSGFIIEESSFDEILEILNEYNLKEILHEGSPVRKMVVRAGRRKIIFRCPPGQKKIKRRCVRRPAGELARLKRSARKAARKARSKRARAARRRKISLKRRSSFAKRRHK
jgi:hypothetical protein